MIKNAEELRQADLEYDREHPLTIEQKYRILEGLYHLAKDAGHFDPSDKSIDEHDVVLAKALNANISQPAGGNR